MKDDVKGAKKVDNLGIKFLSQEKILIMCYDRC